MYNKKLTIASFFIILLCAAFNNSALAMKQTQLAHKNEIERLSDKLERKNATLESLKKWGGSDIQIQQQKEEITKLENKLQELGRLTKQSLRRLREKLENRRATLILLEEENKMFAEQEENRNHNQIIGIIRDEIDNIQIAISEKIESEIELPEHQFIRDLQSLQQESRITTSIMIHYSNIKQYERAQNTFLEYIKKVEKIDPCKILLAKIIEINKGNELTEYCGKNYDEFQQPGFLQTALYGSKFRYRIALLRQIGLLLEDKERQQRMLTCYLKIQKNEETQSKLRDMSQKKQKPFIDLTIKTKQ